MITKRHVPLKHIYIKKNYKNEIESHETELQILQSAFSSTNAEEPTKGLHPSHQTNSINIKIISLHRLPYWQAEQVGNTIKDKK